MKSLYFLSLEACYVFFFFDNIRGLSFHFCLYSEKDENIFYFENFEFSLF